MKKIFGILVISSVLLFGFDYHTQPKQVAQNVWCFFGKLEVPNKSNGGFMSNSCYIKANHSYILVDTGASYEFAKQSYEAMSKIEALPVKVIFNTHSHDDHWLGNNFYKEKFNAKLIGVKEQDSDFTNIKQTRMYHVLTKEQFKGTKLVKLDKHITQTEAIKIDGLKIVLVPIGQKAHTADDVFVYLPDEKILFAGDLVMNGRVTSNRDGSVIGSLKALNMINEKKWDVLIPGHGFDTSKTATKEYEEYFSLLKQRVLKAIEDDVGAENITKVVKMEEFKDKAMYEEVNTRNVFDAYGELEFYDEE